MYRGCNEGAAKAQEDDDASGIVYMGEGRQLAYLPGSARDALGWGR
jgi:hypothetical protein